LSTIPRAGQQMEQRIRCADPIRRAHVGRSTLSVDADQRRSLRTVRGSGGSCRHGKCRVWMRPSKTWGRPGGRSGEAIGRTAAGWSRYRARPVLRAASLRRQESIAAWPTCERGLRNSTASASCGRWRQAGDQDAARNSGRVELRPLLRDSQGEDAQERAIPTRRQRERHRLAWRYGPDIATMTRRFVASDTDVGGPARQGRHIKETLGRHHDRVSAG